MKTILLPELGEGIKNVDIRDIPISNGDKINKTQPIIFGQETNLIEVPISWSLDDSPHFEYHRREGYVQNALKSTKGVLETG